MAFDPLDQMCARAAVDLLVSVVERHEQEDHEGEICPAERTNLVAFVAFHLGVPISELRHIRNHLMDYERDYPDRAQQAKFHD